jgi:hypothetical protein
MLPTSAASMSASVGSGISASSAAVVMIMPLWQKPHCGTSSSSQARCTGCELSGRQALDGDDLCSGVTAPTGRLHERVAAPSMWTVQAPHWATPQPYLVPVSPSCSRMNQSRGVFSSASASTTRPLTLSLAIAPS